MFVKRLICVLRATALMAIAVSWSGAHAQVLAVEPVNIFLHGGEHATTLGITNRAATETAVQVRVYLWTQKDGVDSLTETRDLLVSPPIATIAANATQIVRLVQRSSPPDKEATYRILVDQIPSAASPGMVQIVLRLSIPIFSEPMVKTHPHDVFHLERSAGKLTLVGVNNGNRHDSLQKIELHGPAGLLLTPARGSSPYLLAGSTQRWPLTGGTLPDSVTQFDLSATGIDGMIREKVPVVTTP